MKTLMKQSGLAVMLVAAFWLTASAAEVNSVPPSHTIVLTADAGPYFFGRVIWFTVSFRNGGKEPWVVPTPTESIAVNLYYRPSGSEQHPAGYSFGHKKFVTAHGPDGQEIDAIWIPHPKNISIVPGQSYDFRAAFERDWTGLLVPGLWNVWVEDDSLCFTNEDFKITSNRVEIPLDFTADSVTACLETATNNTKSVSERYHCAKWLQKIMPGLELHWPSDNTPAEKRLTMEAEIQEKLKGFKEYYFDKSHAPAIQAAIQKINQESRAKLAASDW
jgi:hypothetical protein